MASVQDWVQIRLCKVCSALDFPRLVANDAGKSERQCVQLGSLDQLRRRSLKCSLCALIVKSADSAGPWTQARPEEVVECAIFPEPYATASLGGIKTLLERSNHPAALQLLTAHFKEATDALALNILTVTVGLRPVDRLDTVAIQLLPCLHPIPSIESCLSQPIPKDVALPGGRLFSPTVDLRLVRHWMSQCRTRHVDCEAPTWSAASGDSYSLGKGSLPSYFRLIDVEDLCIVDGDVNRTPFLALSYVWGATRDQTHFRTTSQTLASLSKLRSLESAELPQTLRDAIHLTASLCYRYLWIDALCIVQDDDNDKAIQIPRMDSIYAQADITIIAACGRTVYDGLAGFAGKPRVTGQATCRVSRMLSLVRANIVSAAYHRCKWRTRGWTLQERLCARRTLMFTDDQMYWSCGVEDWSESLCLDMQDTTLIRHGALRSMLGCFDPEELNDLTKFHTGHLRSLISQYTSRNLSNESDALNAFEGILRRVSVTTGMNFHWGHSTTYRFGESLSWISESCVRRTETCRIHQADGESYRIPFPSWSWLGWKGTAYDITDQGLKSPSELDFYALSLDGKVKLLASSLRWPSLQTEIDLSEVSDALASSWKGPRSLKRKRTGEESFVGFRDSGRLLFRTSHALLQIRKQLRYSSMDQSRVEWGVFTPSGLEVGSLKSPVIPDEWNGEMFSFVVLSRVYVEDKILKALQRLNVLMIEWSDEDSKIASRICSGVVDEKAWVKAKREWLLLTLQ